MSRDSNSTGWLALAILLCTMPHLVLAQEGETPGDKRLWVSRSRNLEQLDDEIARLYQVLEDAEALPTRLYHDPHGRTLSTILRQEQLYFGAGFPQRNDVWLCKLNPAHCRPEEADPESGQQTFRWINRAGDHLILPNLSFTIGQEWILHDKQPGEDLGALIVETLGGCKTPGPGCLKLLGEMNDAPETVLDPRSSGKVWLPVLRVETWLDISHRPDVQHRLKNNLVPELVVRPRPGEDQGEPPGFAPVPPTESPIEGPSTQGPGTEGPRMTLHPWSDDEVFSLFTQPANGGPLERWEARLGSQGRRLWLEILESQVPELMGYCQFELRHLADYTAPLR